MMKHCFDMLDIDGISIADTIAVLQAWKDEHPDAENDYLSFGWDGDEPYFEVGYNRPMDAHELEFHEKQQAAAAEWQEKHDRETYERLKAKFEGN